MAPQPTFDFDVFLSHNRAQKDWTRQLARRLRDDDFKVWFDQWELPRHAGKDWIGLLVAGVEQSQKVVLVLSPEFLDNEWPEFESRIIIQIDPIGRKERLIPLLHTHCKIPRELGFRQALDFTSAHLGPVEFDFCYQQLAYNLDKSRPYEGDFERFKQTYRSTATEAIPPLSPLPQGSRMPHASNPLFVGRENELKKLARKLTPGSGTTVGVQAAVTGMGGVGKTQLAIEYVHHYGRLYQGVFWLDMETTENAQSEVARCGGPGGMDLPRFAQMSLPDQAAAVRATWEDGRAWLLVFDNVQEPVVVKQWRPKTGCCSVLVTSRRSEWPPELGIEPLPVETLPRENGLELLAQARPAITTDPAQRRSANQICDRLGDLALALSVAATYLRKYKRESLSQYLEALRKQPALQDESLKDVGASFTLSYHKLNAKKKTYALAIQLFHLASHFAPVSISRQLLAASAELDYSQRKQGRQADDALARLRDLGLITEEPDGRILLHRLLCEFARLHPPPDAKADQAAEAVADSLFEFASKENRTGLPQNLATELPHLRQAAAAAEQRGSPSAGGLYNELGYRAKMVAAYTEAKGHYERALKLLEKHLGSNHPDVATLVNNLGDVLQTLGDLEGAKDHFQQALEIDQAALGPNHPNVAIDVNNLGGVLQDLGDLNGAKARFQRALEIDEAALGPNHPNVAIRVNNLGGVLQDLGDLEGAKAHYQRALKIDQATFGPDHPEVATDVNNLGMVLKALGDLQAAKAHFQRALSIFRKSLGDHHPKTRLVAENLEVLGNADPKS
ncbi:MAG: tetratricopeptide repeat protein [Candidatus Acidoferrales bacterium]